MDDGADSDTPSSAAAAPATSITGGSARNKSKKNKRSNEHDHEDGQQPSECAGACTRAAARAAATIAIDEITPVDVTLEASDLCTPAASDRRSSRVAEDLCTAPHSPRRREAVNEQDEAKQHQLMLQINQLQENLRALTQKFMGEAHDPQVRPQPQIPHTSPSTPMPKLLPQLM